MIQLLTIIVCAGCFAKGGYNDHNFRRFYMPILLAGACFWLIYSWQAILILVMIPFLTMKDDDQGLLGTYTKCLYGFLACLGASLGLFLTHHIELQWFILYLLPSTVIYYFVKDMKQILGDCIFGAWIGILVLLIK